jgi:hypothetical protein
MSHMHLWAADKFGIFKHVYKSANAMERESQERALLKMCLKI